MKVTKSFTLNESTIEKLKEFSHREYSTNSASVDKIINKYIDAYYEEEENRRVEREKITPPHFDKIDVNAGNPKPSYDKLI